MISGAIRYESVTDEQLNELNGELEKKDALDVLKWAYGQFGRDLLYACSFGAEGVVLIDLISKVRPDADVVFLDTHLHFRETYELIERVKEKYPRLRIRMVEPELSLAEQAATYGEKLWERNPDLCCRLRKVEPLAKAMKGVPAWLSGLRRSQSPTRAHLRHVVKDHKFQAIKICPLVDWSWDDVWNYIRTFGLPYNELHDKGYPSIGCEKCTLPVEGSGDSRAGRWANSGKTECGLHQP